MSAHNSNSNLARMAVQGKPEFFLKFPSDLGLHQQINFEQVANMLLRAAQLATTTPFQVTYIDRPRDFSVFVVFLLPHYPEFPNDGIVFQDTEVVAHVDAGFGRRLEVATIQKGFVPDEDTAAYRVRRRYRLEKGGHPQMFLLHYSRGPPAPIIPSNNLMNRPLRKYPLPPLNEAPMYVVGERFGQRALGARPPMPAQQGLGGTHPGTGMGGMGMHPSQQAAMLAAQSRNMDNVHQRQNAAPAQPVPIYEDDSGDEYEHMSTRTLALARFKRNHDYMHEVFMYAAYGDRIQKETKSPYSCFKEEDLKAKIEYLEKEVDDLQAAATARRKVSSTSTESEHISMEATSAPTVVLST